MQRNKLFIFTSICLCLIGLLLESCNSGNASTEFNSVLTNTVSEPVEEVYKTIQIHSLQEQTNFSIKLQATGILRAQESSIIRAKVAGKIKTSQAFDGHYIEKGNPIIMLEDERLQLQLQKLQLDLNEAILKKNELLIQSNGEMGVDTSVSPLILNAIHIKSGYEKALQAIKQIQYEIEQTKVYAPFNGIIADVESKQHDLVVANDPICRFFNPHTFEAEFLLLEEEALKIKMGQAVKIVPIAIPDLKLHAEVIRINPVVNNQGLVKLHAKIKGHKKAQLFEGMNLRIFIENMVYNQLVVPKQALVLRSGKEVIFTYNQQDSLAKWNYVKVGHENDHQLAIEKGLNLGDLVIVEGNNNLAHDAKVILGTVH